MWEQAGVYHDSRGSAARPVVAVLNAVANIRLPNAAQKARETKLSDIFSAPLELAKNKIDSAISDDESEDDPAGHLHVASAPCLAGASGADCTKHWAAHYMSRATEVSLTK